MTGDLRRELRQQAKNRCSRFGAEAEPVTVECRAATAIERLEARVKEQREFIKELSDALIAIRPLGGSELFIQKFDEYFADPKYCKAAIEDQSRRLNEAMKESMRQRKEATRLLAERNEAFERLKSES